MRMQFSHVHVILASATPTLASPFKQASRIFTVVASQQKVYARIVVDVAYVVLLVSLLFLPSPCSFTVWFSLFRVFASRKNTMLFTAAGLWCLLLHAANALVNTTHLAASESKSTQASSSSPVSLASKGNISTLSSDAKLLLTTSNSSLLVNDTKLTMGTTARLETTTQNIWTLNPKDASGNNYTFHQLLSLGLDRSEIAIFGIGPGMFDIDFFQVEMTEETVSRYKPGVGAS